MVYRHLALAFTFHAVLALRFHHILIDTSLAPMESGAHEGGMRSAIHLSSWARARP
jgi:hypothetical protein